MPSDSPSPSPTDVPDGANGGPVHIVDDDAAARDSVRMLVEAAGLPTRLYPSAELFLSACDRHTRGCVVADLNMPGMDGLQLQKTLHDRGIFLPIVFVTGYGAVRDAVQAVREGALDFIEKPCPPDLLLRRIREALQFEVSRRAQEQAVEDLRTRFESLSRREREVLWKVIAGQHTKQIALELGISSKTVDSHRSRIMSKMGANSLPDLFSRVFLLRQAHPELSDEY